MYIDIYDYPRYSGRTSAIFEKMLMKVFNVIMIMLIIQGKNWTWVYKEGWSNDENLFP